MKIEIYTGDHVMRRGLLWMASLEHSTQHLVIVAREKYFRTLLELRFVDNICPSTSFISL